VHLITITLLALRGCWATGPVGLHDKFSLAAAHAEKIGIRSNVRVQSVSPDGSPVRAACGFVIPVDSSLDGAYDADIIIPPPVLVGGHDAVLRERTAVIDWIRAGRDRGAKFACTSSSLFILAAAGVLDGRTVAAGPALSERLASEYPMVNFAPDRLVMDDGTVLSYASGVAQFQLGLELVRRHFGEPVASSTATALSYADIGCRYTVADRAAGFVDEEIDEIVKWIETHPDEEQGIEQLAKRFGMSSRNLRRRFGFAMGESPAAYVQRVRFALAMKLLQQSPLVSLNEVALACGYSGTRALSRLVRLRTGQSLAAYCGHQGSRSHVRQGDDAS
jgi:transcriptional regulator GlxA family with amidase domain